jgi:hypothetical protein
MRAPGSGLNRYHAGHHGKANRLLRGPDGTTRRLYWRAAILPLEQAWLDI